MAVVLLVRDQLIELALGGALIGLAYAAVVYPMRSLLKAPAVGPAS